GRPFGEHRGWRRRHGRQPRWPESGLRATDDNQLRLVLDECGRDEPRPTDAGLWTVPAKVVPGWDEDRRREDGEPGQRRDRDECGRLERGQPDEFAERGGRGADLVAGWD